MACEEFGGGVNETVTFPPSNEMIGASIELDAPALLRRKNVALADRADPAEAVYYFIQL